MAYISSLCKIKLNNTNKIKLNDTNKIKLNNTEEGFIKYYYP